MTAIRDSFDEQLTDDIESSRADGEACAELIEACPRARHRDITEITNADHEHYQGGPPQQIERASHVPDEGVLERLDTGVYPVAITIGFSFGGVRSKFTASRALSWSRTCSIVAPGFNRPTLNHPLL